MSERSFEEWGIVYGVDQDDLSAGIGGNELTYDDEGSATEMLQWVRGAALAKRTVHVGPWELVERGDP